MLGQILKHNEAGYTNKEQIIIDEYSEKNHIIYNDPNLIGQVLDNIISNAIKYSEKGKRIWISSNETPDKVLLSIRDEGQGISENEIGKIFQKFAKVSSKPTDGESSTGLGLSIAKHLMNACGGKVTCESKLGIGTTFTIELPND